MSFLEIIIYFKCCFLIEDDMSIASFEKPCSTLSRASLAGYELQTMIDKEIIYIKKSPKIWYEFEDESLCVGSELDDSLSFRTTRSSNSKHSSRKSSANERHVIIKKYKPIRTKIFNKETGKNEVVFINDPQKSSSYIFPTKKSASSSTSRVLDWFMSCCWKCTPGCQQLPTLNM